MKESKFQHNLIGKLKDSFPGCMVLKNDAGYIQGVPDLLVLYEDKWAALECKQTNNSTHQPNQDYYVDYLDKMSYARFVCPENEEEILCELQSTFRPSG